MKVTFPTSETALRVSLGKVKSLVVILSNAQAARAAEFLDMHKVMFLSGKPYKIIDMFKQPDRSIALTLNRIQNYKREADPGQHVMFAEEEST